jgi:hypothetical protein
MSFNDLDLEPNESVVHPLRDLPEIRDPILRANDRFLEWMANNVLASMLMFDIALIVPLLAIPMSDSVKITLGVISGSWIQWWALPALQRSQVKADVKREAKADADHVALTHIANTVEEILARLDSPHPGRQL